MATQTVDKELVRETVTQTLLSFGIDVSDPDSIVRFQKDMHYLRDLRLQSEANKSTVVRKGIELVIAGLLAALALQLGQSIGFFRG